MGSMDGAQAFQGMEALWEALDFSYDMSFRVIKINTHVNCTYAYYNSLYYRSSSIKYPIGIP
ncbi:hypothetical protein [Lutispora sp.]|uniref:hypothetical protein n=1 Tax=Lutispora sp. TaxID=2828727 RepID=UPI0035686862